MERIRSLHLFEAKITRRHIGAGESDWCVGRVRERHGNRCSEECESELLGFASQAEADAPAAAVEYG